MDVVCGKLIGSIGNNSSSPSSANVQNCLPLSGREGKQSRSEQGKVHPYSPACLQGSPLGKKKTDMSSPGLVNPISQVDIPLTFLFGRFQSLCRHPIEYKYQTEVVDMGNTFFLFPCTMQPMHFWEV